MLCKKCKIKMYEFLFENIKGFKAEGYCCPKCGRLIYQKSWEVKNENQR